MVGFGFLMPPSTRVGWVVLNKLGLIGSGTHDNRNKEFVRVKERCEVRELYQNLPFRATVCWIQRRNISISTRGICLLQPIL